MFLVLLIAFLCVGCDQATKAAAKSHLSGSAGLSFAGDTLRLQLTENKGAFLGLGSSLPDRWRALVFVWAAAVALGLLFAYVLVSSTSVESVVSLSLVLGGGFSNLLDRIAYGGFVIDFINFGVGPVRTGIFNIADVAITSGVMILAWSSLRRRRALLPK